MGDSIATNLFMLGFAFQKGFIPLGEASLLRAIELNGVAIDANKQAFVWGRRAAVDLQKVERLASPARPVFLQLPQSLEKLVERRVAFLTAYQNAAYAQRYRQLVERVRDAAAKGGFDDSLAKAVAKYLFKLMAYKDEYEVARLYSDPAFEQQLRNTFDGDFSIKYNLAPPLLAKRDAKGHLVKSEYGAWMKYAFRLLAPFKWLRNTAFDPFGYTAERRVERQLLHDYEATVNEILERLSKDNYKVAVRLASLPEKIRGFGHVKENNIAAYQRERETLLSQLRGATLARAA